MLGNASKYVIGSIFVDIILVQEVVQFTYINVCIEFLSSFGS